MDKLTIVNGMAMYTLIQEGKLDIKGDVVPFNEAMCQGDATENIFSSEFIDERSVALHVLPEEYEEVVINPLKDFFDCEYETLTLYFDSDMFCMVNVLTILAYLDRNDYEGAITLNIIDYNYKVLKTVKVSCNGFYELYLAVLVYKRRINVNLPSELKHGIELYIEYAKGKSKIHKAIAANGSANAEALTVKIMEAYPEYGLGDTQILELIDRMRNKI